MHGLATAMLVVMSSIIWGCSSDEERPECIALPAQCAPLFLPATYDRLFTDIFSKSCGDGAACHSRERHQGGLVFVDVDESYGMLRGQIGGKARVKPGDAACSELVVRTHSIGKPWSMPPGMPLSPEQQCDIRMWVDQGATRQ